MKIFRNLAFRVFFLCLFLAFLPLTVHSLIVWDRDARVFYKSNFQELSLVGEGLAHSYTFWQDEQIQKTPVFEFDSSLQCTQSIFPEMVGTRDFFPTQLGRAFAAKTLSFQGMNPYSHRYEVFTFVRDGDRLLGVSAPRNALLDRLQLTPFEVSFVDGSSVLNNDDWSELSQRELKRQPFALRFSLPNSTFQMVVQGDLKMLAQREGYALFTPLLFALLLTILFGGVVTIWLLFRMARPIVHLQEVMEAVSQGHLGRRFQKARLGFEINTLGDHYNRMLDALLEKMHLAKTEAVERERLSKELQIGWEVQQELLPKELPAFSGLEMGASYRPAKEVSGDFYDVFPMGNDRLLITMADGAGKGISACLYSLMFRSHLRSQISASSSFSEGLIQANHLFLQDVGETGNFVTAWVGLYDAKSGVLTYTNGGHPPALFISGKGVEELTTDGIAFGVQDIESVETKEITFKGKLLLYTDGVTEAHNEKGEFFSGARLIKLVESHAASSPKDLTTQLLEEVERFSVGVDQHDDIALLSLSAAVVT